MPGSLNVYLSVGCIEDSNLMSENEIRKARLLDRSKVKVKNRVEQSQDYIDVRKAIVKDNFIWHAQRDQVEITETQSKAKRTRKHQEPLKPKGAGKGKVRLKHK